MVGTAQERLCPPYVFCAQRPPHLCREWGNQ
jgi:hypothetical protein